MYLAFAFVKVTMMDPNRMHYQGVENEDSLLHDEGEPLLCSISDMSITNTFESKGVTVNNTRKKHISATSVIKHTLEIVI